MHLTAADVSPYAIKPVGESLGTSRGSANGGKSAQKSDTY
ncbi:hypothetical protein Z949_4086 [Sulfitobacter guttiformis KCTC 32187]|nr:hypothetical protein Z949_4086 [Sulfitobacter guttiformis KCTC 32187]